MDPRCRTCQKICKRLDAEDLPVCYRFSSLGPDKAILLMEKLTQKHQEFGHLKLSRCERTEGNQLAISLKMSCPNRGISEDDQVVVVAQTETQAEMSSLVWFRFHVPTHFCERPEVVEELNSFVKQLVEFLDVSDSLLSAASHPQ